MEEIPFGSGKFQFVLRLTGAEPDVHWAVCHKDRDEPLSSGVADTHESAMSQADSYISEVLVITMQLAAARSAARLGAEDAKSLGSKK